MSVSAPWKTDTRVFLVVWFIAAPNWEESQCPSMGEWINELIYVYATQSWRMNRYAEQQPRTSQTYCWAKEARLKRVVKIRSHFSEDQERAKWTIVAPLSEARLFPRRVREKGPGGWQWYVFLAGRCDRCKNVTVDSTFVTSVKIHLAVPWRFVNFIM